MCQPEITSLKTNISSLAALFICSRMHRDAHYIKSQYIRDQFVNPSTTTRSIRLSRRNQLITPHFGALALKYDVITSLRSICSAYYVLVLALDQSDAAVQANHSAKLKSQQTPRVLRRNDIK